MQKGRGGSQIRIQGAVCVQESSRRRTPRLGCKTVEMGKKSRDICERFGEASADPWLEYPRENTVVPEEKESGSIAVSILNIRNQGVSEVDENRQSASRAFVGGWLRAVISHSNCSIPSGAHHHPWASRLPSLRPPRPRRPKSAHARGREA